MDDKKSIEIPFGAKDSELYKFEYTIPDGYEAEIKDGKVIVQKKESEDERIRKNLIELLFDTPAQDIISHHLELSEVLAYLEKQKDFQFGYPGIYFYDGEKFHFQGNPAMEENPYGFAMSQQDEQKPAEWSEKDEHYFQNLIMAVDSTFSEGNTKNWLQNRLKSLRPQPHWKPSEEQMQALWAVEDRMRANKAFTLSNKLASLYNDLKKL